MRNNTIFGSPPLPVYRGRGQLSFSAYVPMRDGVRLAVDVILPKDMPVGERLPTILSLTRYWRSMELKAPFRWVLNSADSLHPLYRRTRQMFAQHGYAQVRVDVRGTGASFGVWRYPWEPQSLDDARQILDWIVAQPWSNGRVGGMGASYVGTTAELLAATGHPAVKAILAMYNHPDAYIDISFPGGLFNERFIQAWSMLDEALDRGRIPAIFDRLSQIVVRGPMPVGGEAGRADLELAIQEHRANGTVYQIAVDVAFRDQRDPETGICVDDLAVHRYSSAIASSGVPIFGWVSWLDAGTADAALRRFLTYPNASRLVIGAWNHGGLMQASPYCSPRSKLSPPIATQLGEIIRFFNQYLRGEDQAREMDNSRGSTLGESANPEANREAQEQRVIKYYTLGAERWQRATEWPPPGVRLKRWYLAGKEGQGDARASGSAQRRVLIPDPPQGLDAYDEFTVDFRASTGLMNRWWELSVAQNKSVVYADRAAQTPYLITYTSPPMPHDLEITGHPVVTLYIASSLPDCAFYIYLEDVTPRGKIIYITEGLLRSIHHPLSSSRPPYQAYTPYRTFHQADARPLVSGQATQITLSLLPTSALVRRGHCLRLSLAGADRGTFPRLPAEGTPQWTIYRSLDHPSWIDLPIQTSSTLVHHSSEVGT